MISIKRRPYDLAKWSSLPEWLKRSWNIFERARIRADYQLDIQEARKRVYEGEGNLIYESLRLQKKYALGQAMDALPRTQIDRPDVTDNQLLNLIPPHIRFINYGLEEIRPSSDPKREFADNEEMRRAFRDSSGVDVMKGATATYILVPPYTSKGELLSFIDEFYDDARPLIEAEKPYFTSERHEQGRIRRVTQDMVIDEVIYQLHKEAVGTPEIAQRIKSEYGREFEPHEIRIRLNKMKKRKNYQ